MGGWLLATTSCGGKDLPEEILELARDPARTTYMERPDRDALAGVLLRGEDVAHWEPFAGLDGEPSDAERAAFLAHARALGDHVEIDGVSGGFGTLVEGVEPGTVVHLSARAHPVGLAPGPGRKKARITLTEFSERPSSFAPKELGRVLVAQTRAPATYGDGVDRETSLLVRTSPETRVLGVFLTLDLSPFYPDARVAWSDIRLTESAPVDHLRAACKDPDFDLEAGAPVGAFTLGCVRRPALAMLAGERVRVATNIPEDAEAFEVWLGLAPQRFSRDGESARLSVAFDGTSGGSLPLLEHELESRSPGMERWKRVVATIPPELRGRRVDLCFEAASDPESTQVAVFGAPRFVRARPERPGPNVLLVSIDTLRADRVGAYGGPAGTTPRLDELAGRSVVHEEAWSTAPYTLPSHVSLLTGQMPGVHGVQRPGERIDPLRSPLLSELLRERGWVTGAFTGGGLVDPTFGFGRGFQRYGTIDTVVDLDSARIRGVLDARPDRDLALVEDNSLPSVIEWIERHADESFFLFFHTYQVHEYDPPAEHLAALGFAPKGPADRAIHVLRTEHGTPTDDQRRRLFELYDAALHCADAAVGEILDALERLGLSDDTIVVVTSDHGEEIGERGTVNHGHSLHQEILHVPLFVHVPGRPAGRSSTPVSIADVAPTILDALDLPLPPLVQGRSLLRDAEERPVFAQVDNFVTGLAMREGRTKTIVGLANRVPETWEEGAIERTFDLAADPRELVPRAPVPERVQRVIAFGRELLELQSTLGTSSRSLEPLDDAARARISELGYAFEE